MTQHRVERRRRFALFERCLYGALTFVLAIGSLWFTSVTEHFPFGAREFAIGSVAGLVLGVVVAVSADWVRDFVFWIFFP